MREGWKIKRLGDVCEKVDYGHTASAKEAGDGPKFLRITDIQNGSVAWHSVPVCECEPNKLKKYILQRGDMVFARTGATTGKSYLVADCPNNAIFASYLIRVRPKTQVSPPYLAYFFQTPDYWEQVSTSSSGSAQPGVNATKLKNLQVPLPPLPEQERIVAILDEAFAAIATATANAEKNLANAQELFESELNRVFSQKGDGWVERPLGEVYDVRDGTHDSPKYHTTGFPLITSKNLKREGLSFEKVNLINEQDYAKINQRSAVHKGDVLFAMIGTIGNPIIVTVEPSFAIKNVALFKVPHGQSGAFLKYYLASKQVISKMMQEAKGTTQKFVGLGYLRKFPINVPLLAKQLEVVESLDELSTETQRLESIYQDKLAALTELKQSILHKAFTGELTADAKAADRTLSEAGL